MDMEDLIEFLQIKLEQDFGYNDDVAVEALQTTILDLQRYRIHIPGRALPDELPQRPFGLLMKQNPRVSFKILNFILLQIPESTYHCANLKWNHLSDCQVKKKKGEIGLQRLMALS